MNTIRTHALVLIALLLTGCATGQPTPQFLAKDFAVLNPQEVILLEVSFLDPPLDSVLHERARTVITGELADALRKKGYRIAVRAGEPVAVWTSDARRLQDLPELARSASGGDAVMHVQIEHFLWAGLGDKHQNDTLDLYATAALFEAGSGRELWRDRGHGRGWETGLSVGLYGPELRQPARSLAGNLFATLPNHQGSR